MPDMTGADAKAEARSVARASRRAGPPADPQGLAASALSLVTALDGVPRVTCYSSYGTEPDTGPMIEALTRAGFEVLLPRVVEDSLEWVRSEGPMQRSSMGIDEPAGPAVDLLPVRAMLIPALAVTGHGDRLGKGGGFYDRALAAIADTGIPIAAIVRDEDIVEELPVEPHDRRVDAIVTSSRAFWVNTGR